MSTRIYHNPKCSTSRKVLQALRDAGAEPEIVEYLKTPPTKAELKDLLKRMGKRPRELLRKKEALYKELGLDSEKKSDEAIIDAMLANPILIERPIVVTKKGVRLGRPPESVNEIL
ncbi:MAG: arsenate reductase (glutaredoxin) [Alphaproteobacteria bacterium]